MKFDLASAYDMIWYRNHFIILFYFMLSFLSTHEYTNELYQ